MNRLFRSSNAKMGQVLAATRARVPDWLRLAWQAMTTARDSGTANPTLAAALACRRGNMAIASALLVVPVLGAAGISIDYVRMRDAREHLQQALDAAVLSGAAASTNNVTAAESMFAGNAVGSQATVTNVKFVKSGNVTITGNLTATMPTTLAGVLGVMNMDFALTAVAQATPGTTAAASFCIMTLSTTASQSLLANSGANIQAPNCQVHVKSTADPAVIFNSGTNLTTSKICIEGKKITDNGGTHPNVMLGCTTPADPYAGKIPVPASASCTYSDMNYSSTTTLNPGTYCGWFNFNSGSNVTLNPGVYVIKSGGWNVNGGTWSGNGVTFYFADTSKIQFNSAVAATLTAPTTGTYAGILMAEKEGLSSSQFVFDDSKGFVMNGVLYLPSREVIFNSGTTVISQKITAIMRTVIFNATNWTLSPYSSGSTSPATKARLAS